MRKIKGTVIITDEKTGKSYKCTTKQMDSLIRKAKIKVAAVTLAAGIAIGTVGNPIITNIRDNHRNANDTKEAIEMAASTETYLNRIKANPILQDVIDQERIVEIEELSSAITTYKQLRYKQDKSFKEERQYIEACGVISESRKPVMNLYTDMIKAKVASAYGITDPNKIAKIEVIDHVQDTNYETKHNPQIVLPDGTLIVQNSFFNKNKGMDPTLAQHVINARSLVDAGMFSEDKKIEDLPLEEIIDTFQEAQEFEDFTISSDEKGNLATTPVEQLQENSDRDR